VVWHISVSKGEELELETVQNVACAIFQFELLSIGSLYFDTFKKKLSL
jgi:hypothetical protein